MTHDSAPIERETLIVPPDRRSILNIDELWRLRAICFVLTRRILMVRYKQTILGAAWAVLQPFLLMLVFTVAFGFLIQMPSDGIPYPLFAYTGLVAWQLFSRALNEASGSIVLNPHLVTKIYFPRLYLPLAVILSAVVDMACALVALVLLLVWYQIWPGWPLLMAPLVLLHACITALGTSLWLSALYASYRDVGHLLPFLTQVWMFLSPIIYPGSLVPEALRPIYALNPMVAVIDGFRWAFAGGSAPPASEFLISLCVSLALLIGGYVFFRKRESVLSDVV